MESSNRKSHEKSYQGVSVTNKELLEEIRLNRIEVKKLEGKFDELSRDFYFFKGKAFGLITVLAIVINVAVHYIKGEQL